MPLLSFVHANTSRQLLVTARENASFSGQKAKARQKKREESKRDSKKKKEKKERERKSKKARKRERKRTRKRRDQVYRSILTASRYAIILFVVSLLHTVDRPAFCQPGYRVIL